MILDDILQPLPFYGVFCARIAEHTVEDKQCLLSPEEQARMARFKFLDDRQRYLMAHGLKRVCLSRLLNTPWDALAFSQTETGKPVCTVGTEAGRAVDFNLSHSGDWAVMGVSSSAVFSSSASIGVDVEPKYRKGAIHIAPRVLSEAQQVSLSEASSGDECFMRYWTQKEAISKAMGLGLSADFKQIDCSGAWGASYAQYCNQGFYVYTVPLFDGYIVSVATQANTPINIYWVNAWNLDTIEVTPLDSCNALTVTASCLTQT